MTIAVTAYIGWMWTLARIGNDKSNEWQPGK